MAPPRKPSPNGQVALDGLPDGDVAAAAETMPFVVTVNGERREFGTVGGVLAELGRHLVDMPLGKLEIAVDRKDPK